MTTKTTTQHTPGPWKWNEGYGAIVAGDGPDMLVTPIWRQGTTAWGDAENSANARLIAAAPDLLAACVNAESALDSKQAVGYLAADRAEYALRVLRAAIARAEGK